MHTLRVFFAIIFPKATQVRLSRSLKTLQNTLLSDYIRWVHVEKMHITVQFLGNLPQEQLILLSENVQAAIKNILPFQLQFGHLEWFPSLRHPKILSLTVQSQADLAMLSQVIGNTSITLDIPVETRPFRGHLTLGRLIRHRVPYELLETIKGPAIPPIMVNKIHLIESRSEKGRQNYYPLAEFKLAEL
ncbi:MULTISPECIES: RNA 2',3'-cyclic phosphodiesterase [Legionella]|uniref:RNA 2',3'-cyclic phosphodiesterase n=1 Tax=Legionella resiliens TaxID=2905958 RepID=A0ABS8X130_9GAMM|nr:MULTISPECIES: RNA 2',3'-cyclic phosphodiesterase [unclassified Legionella]MCE0721634.1 RNA 2',3'-cyclic phosphodiesterase [Legionella sp. 9fVS26]MCE3530788.1 RNA 2',3'-cyclic phosphodiesterase [Legionella sp. 8cVS16]QLZ70350.1 RNA 2',3'-cyclic phosphodiesterase [Legionella sp. PC1000]